MALSPALRARRFLSWEEFLTNQRRLLQNYQAHGGGERKAGAAREGPALLQGLALCGRCGRMMGHLAVEGKPLKALVTDVPSELNEVLDKLGLLSLFASAPSWVPA